MAELSITLLKMVGDFSMAMSMSMFSQRVDIGNICQKLGGLKFFSNLDNSRTMVSPLDENSMKIEDKEGLNLPGT